MCQGESGEILSNIELVLPWNVVKTCYSLETNTQSCFLAVNSEEKTSSQITVKKQADESVKITVTVMALDESEGEEEEQEIREEPGLFEEPREEPVKRGSKRTRGKRDSDEPAVGQSKIARLRQQGAKSPARTRAGRSPRGEEQEEEATPRRVPVKREKAAKGQEASGGQENVDASSIQEVIEYMQDQEQPEGGAGEVAPEQGGDQVEITSMKVGRQKRGRPIYMPDPNEKPTEEEDPTLEEEQQEEEEGPEIEIEQSGGSTIIIVKSQDEKEEVEKTGKGKGFYTETRQPFKKRWSAIPGAQRYKTFYTENEHKRRHSSPYDMDGADDKGIVKRKIKRVPRLGHVGCKYCEAMVTDYAYLYRHVRKMHSDMEDMQEYLESLRPLMESTCPICDKSFQSTSSIVAHIRQYHSEITDSFQCDQCDEICKTQLALLNHKRDVHGKEKTYECEVCSHEFESVAALNDHVVNEHVAAGQKEEVYQCDICQKLYLTAGRLQRHKLIHGAFRFFCPYCSKGFHLKDNMNKHIRIVHEYSNSPTHKCPTCDKTFLVKGNLTQHIKGVHMRVFPFNCVNCKMGFRRIKSLEKHMEMCSAHPGEEEETAEQQQEQV